MDDLYQEHMLDHFHHPRHKGTLERWTHQAVLANLSCGDEISIQLLVQDGVIVDIGWTGEGCAVSQASASVMTDAIIGKSLEKSQELTLNDVSEHLGIPISEGRSRCALLFIQALQRVKEEK